MIVSSAEKEQYKEITRYSHDIHNECMWNSENTIKEEIHLGFSSFWYRVLDPYTLPIYTLPLPQFWECVPIDFQALLWDLSEVRYWCSVKRSGTQSAFQIIPKVPSAVEVRPLSAGHLFFYTSHVCSWILLSTLGSTVSCWNIFGANKGKS